RCTLPRLARLWRGTRTISSTGREGPGNDPVDHARRAGALEGCRELIERRAGGHDIIDHGDRRAVERALAAERAAHVARPVRPRQIGLGSRISFSNDDGQFEARPTLSRDMAGNFRRLVVAALPQPLV